LTNIGASTPSRRRSSPPSKKSSSTAAPGPTGSSCNPPCSNASRRSTTASAGTPPSTCSPQPTTNSSNPHRSAVENNRSNKTTSTTNPQASRKPGQVHGRMIAFAAPECRTRRRACLRNATIAIARSSSTASPLAVRSGRPARVTRIGVEQVSQPTEPCCCLCGPKGRRCSTPLCNIRGRRTDARGNCDVVCRSAARGMMSR
jgi:hypothetical protein